MYRSPSIGLQSDHNIETYNSKPVVGTVTRGKLSTFNYSSSNEDYLKAWFRINVSKLFCKVRKNTRSRKKFIWDDVFSLSWNKWGWKRIC